MTHAGALTPGNWLDRQPCAETRRELGARFSRHAIDSDVASGSIVRLLPNVYVGGGRVKDFETRCLAALHWAGPNSVIGGTAAAHAHGLLPDAPWVITVCVEIQRRLHAPRGFRLIQPSLLGPPVKRRGLRVVPACDAALQSWAQLGRERGTGLMLDAVRANLIHADAIAARAREYPRIPHRPSLNRRLDPLRAGVDSYLEHVAATRVFNTREFDGFRRQVKVAVHGRNHVLDLFDARVRLAIELDGRRYHGDDEARRRDLARDAELAAIGIQTIRLTFEDIIGRPEWCRARVRQAISARRRAA